MKVLVTGCAGFIGMHVVQALLRRGLEVVGLDNLNGYYDPALKRSRLTQVGADLRFFEADVADSVAMQRVFAEERPQRVVHLAAQAGVRYSLENPHAYAQSNLVGFLNILEGCRHHAVEHLVYASSSSVYGANARLPFSVDDNVDHPVSLYAATKKANELMAHSYSHLYGIPCTGLRYFTVYGPWGRPDMAPWLFTSAILEGRPIKVFNHGRMLRDFTYIDDIVEGTARALEHVPGPDERGVPCRVYNIGNSEPVELLTFIETLESALGREARKEFLPMQPGDVPATYADVGALRRDVGFEPKTSLAVGLRHWADWYVVYTAT